MKIAHSLLIATLLTITFIKPALASNNHFGIHIFDESDLQDAANLVNSNGGEWGYVTLVVREDERDINRWQRAFDQMRRLKLIPIVRIATNNENGVWKKPAEQEATNWALFLDSLNWPTKSRYIILFNEPNHDYEWGGQSNPREYSKIARIYLEKLKEFSYDFFVMPAALDLAAPNGRDTISADTFYSEMNAEDQYLWAAFDGLASHSYPNPGFSGNAGDTGQKSIQGYKWEIAKLSEYGLQTDIPVFITETGWVLNSTQTEKVISQNFLSAYNNIWNDPQIMAVTPFILSYISPPFDNFSWKNPETYEYRQYYQAVKEIVKTKGTPEQIHGYQIEQIGIPSELVSNSSYSFSLKLKNTGQSIWQKSDGFSIHYNTDLKRENIDISPVPYTEPGQVATIPVRIFTDQGMGNHTLTLLFNKDNQPIGNEIEAHFNIEPPPSIVFQANFLFSGNTAYTNFQLSSEHNSQTFNNVLVKDGLGEIPAVYNIIPNREYTYTLSRPGYLPSKVTESLVPLINKIDFGTLLPLDLNGDGKLDFSDLLDYLRSPLISGLKIFSS